MKTFHTLLIILTALVLLASSPGSTAAQQATSAGPIADVSISEKEILWAPRVPYAGLILTIAAPDGTVAPYTFGPGIAPALSIDGPGGKQRLDGIYTYELRVIPLLDDATRAALAAAAGTDARAATVERLRQSGALPPEQVQSGTFHIVDGAFMVPSPGPEPIETAGPTQASAPAMGAGPTSATAPQSGNGPLAQVVATDLIVQGSACVGLDCVDPESFGFDTIRLKENNLRIKFNDTSTAAGFAANNWQLTANDSGSGGANMFAIDDVTGAKTPFKIIAGAPTGSVYVDSIGRIGLGTSTPALHVHINQGDTPAIRLEQNASSGFTAQTWDVAGNEANFFVRDLTSGSQLPFRIRPGAPTSSIDIAASGNVGIGTSSPQDRLHVNGNVRVEGSVIELSDANAKRDFIPIDGREVLLRLRAVPIATWSYRTDSSGARHMGPTAQDFYAAFGLGEDNHHIAPLDVNGVALAAIQELDRMVRERDTRIAALERENADLDTRLARLEQLVAEMAKK